VSTITKLKFRLGVIKLKKLLILIIICVLFSSFALGAGEKNTFLKVEHTSTNNIYNKISIGDGSYKVRPDSYNVPLFIDGESVVDTKEDYDHDGLIIIRGDKSIKLILQGKYGGKEKAYGRIILDGAVFTGYSNNANGDKRVDNQGDGVFGSNENQDEVFVDSGQSTVRYYLTTGDSRDEITLYSIGQDQLNLIIILGNVIEFQFIHMIMIL